MLNKAEVLRECRRHSKQEMMDLLRIKYGIQPSAFEKTMRELLPKEQDFQRSIMDFIKQRYPKAFVWKAAAGPYSRGGIPDVCVIINGHYFGFEVKRPFIGKASAIQIQTIKQIKAAGGTAAVVSWPEEVDAIIYGSLD